MVPPAKVVVVTDGPVAAVVAGGAVEAADEASAPEDEAAAPHPVLCRGESHEHDHGENYQNHDAHDKGNAQGPAPVSLFPF